MTQRSSSLLPLAVQLLRPIPHCPNSGLLDCDVLTSTMIASTANTDPRSLTFVRHLLTPSHPRPFDCLQSHLAGQEILLKLLRGFVQTHQHTVIMFTLLLLQVAGSIVIGPWQIVLGLSTAASDMALTMLRGEEGSDGPGWVKGVICRFGPYTVRRCLNTRSSNAWCTSPPPPCAEGVHYRDYPELVVDVENLVTPCPGSSQYSCCSCGREVRASEA
jgi:hypothetical protein